MKQCYPKSVLLLAFFSLIFFLPKPLSAQCLCSDGSPATTEKHNYSTTFSSNSTNVINIPKFNAATGTLVCVNAKVFLTSVVRMKLENDEVFNIEYEVRYQRKDTFSGPGISPSVTGSANKAYGPYLLGASDGNSFSGSDFVSIGPDTIYNKKLYEATTTDVVPYLGTGSVNFLYKSVVNTFAIGSDVYALAVTSQNKLDFTMTYSYCNTSLLPLNIKNFQAELSKDNTAFISWMTQNETKNNNYEIEVSENGAQFYTIGTKPADAATAKYEYQYHFDKSLAGILYVRIKQVDGKTVKYSEVRTIHIGNTSFPKLNIYPNPVVQNLNMEFDEPMNGEFYLELANQVGQVVYQKKLWLNNSRTIEVIVTNPPPPGIYYLKAKQTGSTKVYSGKLLFRR
jgi:hypothetical protein